MPESRQSIPAMMVTSRSRLLNDPATAGCQEVVISLRNIPEHLLRRTGPGNCDGMDGQGSFPARRMRRGRGSDRARQDHAAKPKIVPLHQGREWLNRAIF